VITPTLAEYIQASFVPIRSSEPFLGTNVNGDRTCTQEGNAYARLLETVIKLDELDT
jgi:hypothetical protein